MDEEERVKFDNGVREVIFGKSHQHPLPSSLNGKFDALPPVEGVMFDFVSARCFLMFRACAVVFATAVESRVVVGVGAA